MVGRKVPYFPPKWIIMGFSNTILYPSGSHVLILTAEEQKLLSMVYCLNYPTTGNMSHF